MLQFIARKGINPQLLIVTFSTAVLLAVATKSSAQTLVYDGFNYSPAGSYLTNVSGATYVDNVNSGGDSFGWAQRYNQTQAGGSVTNLAAGMDYTDFFGNKLVTDPGSAQIGNINNSVSANTLLFRTFQLGSVVSGSGTGTIYSGLSGGTYWISFLADWIGPQNVGAPTLFSRLGSISFSKGAQALGNSVNGQVSIGRPNTNAGPLTVAADTWSVWTSNSVAPFVPSTGTSLTGTNMILMKLVIDATTAPDQIYTWVNWTNLASEPDISTATLNTNANLTSVNELRIETDGSATLVPTVIQFDEFRLGNTFGDVTPFVSAPEPTTLTLAGLGGVTMLTLLRRRRK